MAEIDADIPLFYSLRWAWVDFLQIILSVTQAVQTHFAPLLCRYVHLMAEVDCLPFEVVDTSYMDPYTLRVPMNLGPTMGSVHALKASWIRGTPAFLK